MLKKIILGVATFAMICVAYSIYVWRDPAPRRQVAVQPLPERRTLSQPATSTQPEAQTFSFKGARIPPGESPKVSVLDEKGNAKIVFQSTRWEPISDNEFHLTDPTARLLLPGGQLAYVWADEGQVTLQRGDGNNFNPRSGWLRGNVRIFIDRTKPEWRQANPDRAELEQHPEAVVKIWLDDVTFDLDLGRLDSNGSVVVQSVDASIEGQGLELIWNEVDRRIRLLRIAHGKRAVIRGSDVMEFGIAGGKKQGKEKQEEAPATQPVEAPPVEVATAAPNQENRSTGLAFQNLEEDDTPRPRDDRVDTYKIEFRENIVARQRSGARITGQLRNADVLQLIADIGREERAAVENAPSTRPAGTKSARTRPAVPDPAKLAATTLPAGGESVLELEWSGELVATPIESAPQPDPNRPERLHLIAQGSPVEVRDAQNGDAVCRELEYHGETKQVWLRGTPEEHVTMSSIGRGRLSGQTVYFDPKTGVARVDGAGRMVTRRARRDQSAEEVASVLDETGVESGEIAWKRSAVIEFARSGAPDSQPAAEAPTSAPERAVRVEYIRRAVFDGGVVMKQETSAIAADHVDVDFAEPQAGTPGVSDGGMVVTKVVATGAVQFEQMSERKGETDRVSCNRLEVEMDGTAANNPQKARAFGNVVARQTGPRTRREIRAGDTLELTMASVPRPVTDAERQRLEAMARAHPDIQPGSPQWVAIETKLRNRRRTVARDLTAVGTVSVKVRDARDADRNLDLMSQSLDCTFSEGEEIDRALIVGTAEHPASVETGEIYVKGPQISIDLTAQTVEVPGEGIMRFMAREDLDGRAVDRPVPVVVSWKERMAFRGKDNRGTFTGTVRAASENALLDCRELRIEFQDTPRAQTQPAWGADRWIFGPIVEAVRAEPRASGPGRVSEEIRKRPVYLWAVGDAVIQSSTYETAPARVGPFTQLLAELPDPWQPKDRGAQAARGRLLSRLRAAGPQIRIDLVQRHFGVEGAGNMSIEDYRLPAGRRGPSEQPRLTALGEAGMSALSSSGPSQTVFTWQSSMTYLNNQNLAVFDDTVRMNHAAGGAMVMKAEFAAAMKLDTARLGKLESRQAQLACDNLLVEFERDKTRTDSPSPLSRATKLRRFEAKGSVQLNLDEGKQAVTGTLVTYNSTSGEVKVTGSPTRPAQILEQDERTAKLNIIRADPGRSITWNEKTRLARVEGSSIVGTGR